MTALLVLLALSLVSALLIYAIRMYDLNKYGEAIERPDGSIKYSKSINKGVPSGRAIRSRSFVPIVTKGATLLSLTHKN